MTDEAIRDKIAKLMRLAVDDGAAPNEAETALRQAQKLMRKHNIELAEVIDRTGQKPIFHWGEAIVPVAQKPVKKPPLWAGWVGLSLGKLTCSKVSYWYDLTQQSTIRFQGEETDIAYAAWLFAHIRDSIWAAAIAYVAPGRNSDERWANREEFRHQMARRICVRIEAMAKENEDAYRSSGTALVVVNDKRRQMEEEFGEQQVSKRKSSHMRGSRDAQRAGNEAGNSVSLNRAVGDGVASTKRLEG